MSIFASFQIALEAIRVNKMRSVLTMLGIIIGVASVITMVSVGSGAQREVENQINSLGTNMLMIFPGSAASGGRRFGAGSATPFSEDDVTALIALPDVIAGTGTIRTGGQIVYGNQNWATSIEGVEQDYLLVRDWDLTAGRNFSAREIRSAGKVAIIGQTIAEKLFGASDPVGQRIRVKNVPMDVIGVLARKGQTSFGTDQDDVIIVPLATARNRLAGRQSTVAKNVARIMVKLVPGADPKDAQTEIEKVLRQRRRIDPGAEDDFAVRNLSDFLRARNETQSIFAVLLGATASISLLVGGIGIMNIMLVSVTERTREIGLRLAVGARAGDVMAQFLVEAVTLALIGGAIGILLGVGAAQAVTRFAQWPTLIGPEVITASAAFSALVGVFFGFYPARKAARLNPIDALRYE